MSSASHSRRITLSHLQKMKQRGEKITCLTVYDATFARLLADAGIELLLVGDSSGMVVAGHSTTVPVTVKDMCYHTHNVCRAQPISLILSDLPFLSYTQTEQALRNTARLMQAGAEMIKIEGGMWLVPIVEQLSEKGVPVCVHLGLTPQSVHIFGGYKVQGRDPAKATQMLATALALEKAGAQLLVLECIPYNLAQEITQAVSIPTIGIGAGPYCDGQVLVTQDMLGLTAGKPLVFVKNFLDGQTAGVLGAVKEYIRQVKASEFPTLEQSFA
ncbi:MAG TPA: 3-methyl-2-oxobutanoate hydroxymethyltransferase [Gammaproteobacteria bacterium]|nr:3-methyl-2-oxobutanoate hydroxymethyltransferase [Gammaproteobacteria bacterium]